MACLSKEENEIINVEFKKASADELLIIKKLIIDVKNHKGLYQDVVKNGADLYSSKLDIMRETGLEEIISGILARTLWGITRPEKENTRCLRVGINEAEWCFVECICRHPAHRLLHGKKYAIRKGMKIGFFKHIHPGQLVGCGCLSRPIIPGLKNT
ncbi:TPA: hypothetical protein PW803_002544 [Escherichia coli]|nr:hypothetical protein [Escherichia coli]HCN6744575.1 hypothetical protein [Escherichia coli]HCN8756746.1 hypothetical protein [Escherichia coli]HDL3629746.1 hypothetical protein [Escherichia coli]